jgi:hypothetical protein
MVHPALPNLLRSLEIYMGNEGSHRRIRNRLRCSNDQFVLRRHRNIIGGVDLIPLRERTALNVNGLGLRRLVDRVRSEKAAHLPDGCPRTSGPGFWTVSSIRSRCSPDSSRHRALPP